MCARPVPRRRRSRRWLAQHCVPPAAGRPSPAHVFSPNPPSSPSAPPLLVPPQPAAVSAFSPPRNEAPAIVPMLQQTEEPDRCVLGMCGSARAGPVWAASLRTSPASPSVTPRCETGDISGFQIIRCLGFFPYLPWQGAKTSETSATVENRFQLSGLYSISTTRIFVLESWSLFQPFVFLCHSLFAFQDIVPSGGVSCLSTPAAETSAGRQITVSHVPQGTHTWLTHFLAAWATCSAHKSTPWPLSSVTEFPETYLGVGRLRHPASGPPGCLPVSRVQRVDPWHQTPWEGWKLHRWRWRWVCWGGWEIRKRKMRRVTVTSGDVLCLRNGPEGKSHGIRILSRRCTWPAVAEHEWTGRIYLSMSCCGQTLHPRVWAFVAVRIDQQNYCAGSRGPGLSPFPGGSEDDAKLPVQCGNLQQLSILWGYTPSSTAAQIVLVKWPAGAIAIQASWGSISNEMSIYIYMTLRQNRCDSAKLMDKFRHDISSYMCCTTCSNEVSKNAL